MPPEPFLPAAVASLTAAAPSADPASIGSPGLWAVTLGGLVALLLLDLLLTRRPHEVSLREAAGWSAFYLALPVAFGVWLWQAHGADRGLEFYTAYLVEKSLSVDNLFIFILLLTGFAVPAELRQRVLLIGVAGALVMRGIFIALGAQLVANFALAFLAFGLVLLATAAKVGRDALRHVEHTIDVGSLRIVRLLRRVAPVQEEYAGPRFTVRRDGRRVFTPFTLVVAAILATDLVFAVDSVPAVFGITEDAYLVFVTNAFALLGLRALYFLLAGALAGLAHLGHGLALILGVIGVKLVLHWAHGVWPAVPVIPTLASLVLIVAILATVVVTSLVAARRSQSAPNRPAPPAGPDGPDGSAARTADAHRVKP